jgi:glycosyltransferase involved in cell wall biosynthesis
MDTSSPEVSIVIPCRNEKNRIVAALDSILRQKPPSGGFEVIVADGMSDDGTRELLQRLAEADPRITVIDNPARIVSTGLNEAIRLARGEIIIRMDCHTTYAEDYIRRCVEVLRETNADNVGGPWIATGTGFVGQAIAAAFQSPFAVGGAKGHDPNCEGRVDTVYLGCWRKDVFQRYGLFDEELVRNQDDEFNLRITRAGGHIWQSKKIRSWYDSRQTLGDLFAQYLQYGYWKVRILRKHKIPACMRHLMPGFFVLALALLPALSFVVPTAMLVWTTLISVYLVASIVASVFTASAHRASLFVILPIVFACYHFAYGLGFLRGILDFIILRQEPATAYSRLTRSHSIR